MRIVAVLPADRLGEGVLYADDHGPFRCRGKSDNQWAAEHGNPERDPERTGGDHPCGSYRVTGTEENVPPRASYGPVVIKLDPIGGEALTAKQNGRSGLWIHGGDPGLNGILRPTHGCLRVDDSTAIVLAGFIALARSRGEEATYECHPE